MNLTEILIGCIVGLICCCVALLVAYIRISNKKTDGELHIIEESDKDVYRFVLYKEPEEFESETSVTFMVIREPIAKKTNFIMRSKKGDQHNEGKEVD